MGQGKGVSAATPWTPEQREQYDALKAKLETERNAREADYGWDR